MAKTVIRIRPSAAYFGVESSFGVTPSMTRCFPVTGSVELSPDQAELEVDELKSDMYDYVPPVKGIQGGTLKWTCHLRPDATQIVAATTATRTWLGMMLFTAFGGEFPADTTANASSTVVSSSGTPVNSVTVTAAGGAKYNKGQAVLMPSAGGGAYEPSRVVNVATDTLTLNPALSGSPSVAAVVQPWNYYPNPGSPPSGCFQFAFADETTQQWTLNGLVITSLEFKFERGAIPTVTFTAKIGAWTGPSAQSIVTTAAANPMGKPFSLTNMTSVLQPVATATRTQNQVLKLALKLNLGLDYVEDLTSPQGRSAVVRKGDRMFAEATVTQLPDTNYGVANQDADWWGARTPLQFFAGVPAGSGATARWMGIDLPTCVLVGKPKLVTQPGYEGTEYALRTLISTAVTSPALSDYLARCPFNFYFG